MPHEATVPMGGAAKPGSRTIPREWQSALKRLALVAAALVILAGRDWANMLGQWWNSSTYNHILLVPLILGWLVAMRWEQVRTVAPRIWWPGLIGLAGTCFIWLLSRLAGFDLGAQAAAVAMLQFAVITALGLRASYALMFPIFYMVFLVPFGDELVPTMQMVTARIVIWLTHASGIPAEIDGVFIDTPAGLFEVAEACSGVKFLVAMVALGALVCNVAFRSWKRRAGFMALALAVPIVANGLRAWGTIYMAQIVGIDRAAGFDHIIYGWIFFALVMALTLALGWRFFDRAPGAAVVDLEAIHSNRWIAALERREVLPRSLVLATGALVLITGGWAYLASSSRAQVPEQIFAPAVPGWTQEDYAPDIWWEPRASGADHRILARYRSGDGQTVDLFVAMYSHTSDEADPASYGEGALTPDSPWRWLQDAAPLAGLPTTVMQAEGTTRRSAATAFIRDGKISVSRGQLKLGVLADKLLFDAQPVAMVIVSGEGHEVTSRRAMGQFLRDAGGPGAIVDAAMHGQ